MKKSLITVTVLALLATSSVFATTVTKEITAISAKFSKNLQMKWAINNQADAINVTNGALGNFNVYIAVKPSIEESYPIKKSDSITVTGCLDGAHIVQAGSMIACGISPRSTATIQISPQDFKNGSNGIYSN